MPKKTTIHHRLAATLVILLSLLNGCANHSVSVLHQTAEKGDVQAQYELGYKYESGIDVQQDLQQARHWYELSAKQGNTWAQNNLDRLNHSATQVTAGDNSQPVNNPITVTSQLSSAGNANSTVNNQKVATTKHDVSEALVSGKEVVVSNILLELISLNIDGGVVVINEDGTINKTGSERSLRLDYKGYREFSLSKYMKYGENIILILFKNENQNYVRYNMESNSDKDKWGYNYKFVLLGDEEILWNEAKGKNIDNIGVQYWTSFSVNVMRDGKYRVKQSSEKQNSILSSYIKKLNTASIKNNDNKISSSKEEIEEASRNMQQKLFEAIEKDNEDRYERMEYIRRKNPNRRY